MKNLSDLLTAVELTSQVSMEYPGCVILDATAYRALKTRAVELSMRHTGTETQRSIMQWANDTFGATITPGRAALRSLEEMVELCVEVGLSDVEVGALVAEALGAARAKRKGIQHAAEELADVYITLCRLAWALSNVPRGRLVPRDMYDTNTVDIQTEVDRKMQVNRARQWVFDGQGSGQHVEHTGTSSDQHMVDALRYTLTHAVQVAQGRCDSCAKLPGGAGCPYVGVPIRPVDHCDDWVGAQVTTVPVCPTCLGLGEVDERLGGEAHSGVVPCPDCKSESA